MPDYTWFWWKLRPHPRLDTVQVRAVDAQAYVEDTAGVVALAHCLARHATEACPEADPPAEVLEEGAFRCRRPPTGGCGLSASCSTTRSRSRGRARELDCADELDVLPARCWSAAAAPGASAPGTRWLGWTRCSAS